MLKYKLRILGYRDKKMTTKKLEEIWASFLRALKTWEESEDDSNVKAYYEIHCNVLASKVDDELKRLDKIRARDLAAQVLLHAAKLEAAKVELHEILFGVGERGWNLTWTLREELGWDTRDNTNKIAKALRTEVS